MINEARVRADTPGCLDQAFLDSAGSSLPPRQVLDTVIGHLRREAEVGGYRAAAECAEDLAGLRRSIARLLNASGPETIALQDSATRAWAQFFYSVPLRARDRILVAQVEYASNAVAILAQARRVGASVEVVPSDSSGQLDVEALADMLDERVRLVSLVHVPTNGGLINPVREVVELVHGVGGLVLLDACQSVGQLSLDVTALDVDAVTATGRKWLRGPRGTGFLYVRPGLIGELEPAMIDLHSAEWTGRDSYRLAPDARRFELWEADIAGRLGLKTAVDYLLDLGMDAVAATVSAKAARLRTGLAELDGVTLTDLGRQRGGIVSFTVRDVPAGDAVEGLAARGVRTSASRATSTLLDMTGRGLDAVVRMSPHYFVSDDQLDAAVRAVADLRHP
ncbi:aminotransferase class V-fold PLP-dependent enzyme [Pseudonocardia spinosispora]|uniref:aminotransferase class V-fold PLP-dependent enzyme n=1 Tax=Pseudonocardia spinosispora TaxID=103441 RepID=UPI0004070529